MHHRFLLLPTMSMAFTSVVVQAADNFQIHGYASQGYFVTNHNDFLSRDSEGTGTFDQIEAGLNVVATPVDRLRVGIQVTASDLGEYGDMRPQIDWAFGEYDVPELVSGLSLQVTGGRFKAEYGFYNEYRDLDMTRTNVFLPFTVYDPRFRDAFISINGAQVKAGLDMKAAGSVDLSARIGNPTWDSKNGTLATYFNLSGATTTDITSDYAVGAALTWNTPLDGLRARISYLQCENLDIDLSLGGTNTLETLIQHYRSGVVGLEYAFNEFTFVGEAKQTYFKSRDTYEVGITLVDEEFTRENGAYLSAAWRFHPKFEGLIGGQWGLSDGDLDGSPVDPTPGERKHHRSINIALRWDVTDHWLIKAEAMWADGTLLITGGEQQDTPNGIQENWSLYTLKTTFDF